MRRGQEYIGRTAVDIWYHALGRRRRGRPDANGLDCINRDMRAVGTTEDEVYDRLEDNCVCQSDNTVNRAN